MGIRNLKKFMRILIIVIIIILIAIFCYYFFFLGQTLAAALTSLIGVLKAAGWWLLGGAALAAAAVSPKTAGGMLQDGYDGLRKAGNSAAKRGKELWSWLKWVVIGGVAFAVYNKASEKKDAASDSSPSTPETDNLDQADKRESVNERSLTDLRGGESTTEPTSRASDNGQRNVGVGTKDTVAAQAIDEEPVNSKDAPDARYIETDADEPLADESGAENG